MGSGSQVVLAFSELTSLPAGLAYLCRFSSMQWLLFPAVVTQKVWIIPVKNQQMNWGEVLHKERIWQHMLISCSLNS